MAPAQHPKPRDGTVLSIAGLSALVIAAIVVTSPMLSAGDQQPSRTPLSQEELIVQALSAAPAHVARDAGVRLHAEDGTLVEVRKGTNGFTCVPMADPNVPTRDPMCMDEAALQWLTLLMNNEPKPANPTPGIFDMAKGAHGWVKDKQLVPKQEPGAKLVHFPAHWMISWPFNSNTSGFPDCANDPEKVARAGNTCIAEPGSPAAFLAIYQDSTNLIMQ